MHRGLALAATAVIALAACSDDRPPQGRPSSSASVSSGSDQTLVDNMGRSLAQGLRDGSKGKISQEQAECLATEIAARVRKETLTSISSTAPDPKSLPRDVRDRFGEAFDHCLPRDLADQLRDEFGT